MDDLSNKLTIGQFARFNNVSEQTLRYYDQIGLLRPTSGQVLLNGSRATATTTSPSAPSWT